MDLKTIIKNSGMKMVDVAREWTLYEEGKDGIKIPKKKGVLTQNINQICNSQNIGLNNLKELARILKISVAELVAKIEDKNYTSVVCPECGAKLKIYIEKEENKPAKADLQAE